MSACADEYLPTSRPRIVRASPESDNRFLAGADRAGRWDAAVYGRLLPSIAADHAAADFCEAPISPE